LEDGIQEITGVWWLCGMQLSNTEEIVDANGILGEVFRVLAVLPNHRFSTGWFLFVVV
jgi:hypothetical protein